MNESDFVSTKYTATSFKDIIPLSISIKTWKDFYLNCDVAQRSLEVINQGKVSTNKIFVLGMV